ncbi:MAG: hypothetical protein L6V88_00775 [Anaerotruncus sp.]|nr:MAG: hypothetical protein L6V88_00775 [Anaerotruncus sp.]
MTVLVFSGKDQVLVHYTDFKNNTEYIVSMLDCGDMDYAMEVAETVKRIGINKCIDNENTYLVKSKK